MADSYDLVVIGGGPGGYTAAIRAAQLKMKVACIEKRAEQGPRRHLPQRRLHPVRRRCSIRARCTRRRCTSSPRHGIKVGGVALDLPAMLARKDKVVKDLTGGVAVLFKKYKVTPLYGAGQVARRQQGRGDRRRTARRRRSRRRHILLATGSESIELPFLKFDGKHIVSSTEALNFNPVPKHLIVVGGGYIGLELGSVWKRLGSKVTVLEFLPRILSHQRRRDRGRGAEAPHEAGHRVPPRHEGDRREGEGRQVTVTARRRTARN